MKEDHTSPETPVAKGNSDPPPGAWQPPRRDGVNGAAFAPVPDGAEMQWAFGSGRVRTFQAKGVTGVFFAVALLFVIGLVFALILLFALGVGTAVALGAGVAAALGMGAARLRRRLGSGRPRELGRGEP